MILRWLSSLGVGAEGTGPQGGDRSVRCDSATCGDDRPVTDLIDVHTHAIAPDLPVFGDAEDGYRWPSVERTGARTARILLGGRPYREVDERCWSAERRLRDMDD